MKVKIPVIYCLFYKAIKDMLYQPDLSELHKTLMEVHYFSHGNYLSFNSVFGKELFLYYSPICLGFKRTEIKNHSFIYLSLDVRSGRLKGLYDALAVLNEDDYKNVESLKCSRDKILKDMFHSIIHNSNYLKDKWFKNYQEFKETSEFETTNFNSVYKQFDDFAEAVSLLQNL